MKKYMVMTILGIGAMIVAPFSAFAGDSSFGNAGSVEANAQLNIWWASGDIERDDSLVDVVKWAVNRVLWISGLIVVIILIYGWFTMVTAAWNDEQYKKWLWVVKAAAIWLMIIWFAWFIASIWFWLAQQVWENAWPAWTET
jgi:hypothetical protein